MASSEEPEVNRSGVMLLELCRPDRLHMQGLHNPDRLNRKSSIEFWSLSLTRKSRCTHITVADGFEFQVPETRSATVFVTLTDDMVECHSAKPDLMLPERASNRFSGSVRTSKINCMSMARQHAKRTWRLRLQAMMRAGATVEVLRHADL